MTNGISRSMTTVKILTRDEWFFLCGLCRAVEPFVTEIKVFIQWNYTFIAWNYTLIAWICLDCLMLKFFFQRLFIARLAWFSPLDHLIWFWSWLQICFHSAVGSNYPLSVNQCFWPEHLLLLKLLNNNFTIWHILQHIVYVCIPNVIYVHTWHKLWCHIAENFYIVAKCDLVIEAYP